MNGAASALIVINWVIWIWISIFIVNKIAYVCCVGAASYYFTSSAEKEGTGEIMQGLKWSSTTNMGSLALGAFIITLLKIARSLME